MLYESDLRGADPLTTLRDRVDLADPPVNPFTVDLVEGVHRHRRGIDDILTGYSDGWTIDRMPGVDRAVLRLGVYELMWSEDTPDAVIIDEAVELAKSLSTDESPRFVNGVLARVLRDRALLRTAEAARDAPPADSTPAARTVELPSVESVPDR